MNMKQDIKKSLIYLGIAAAALLSAAALYLFAAAHPGWVTSRFLPWSRSAVRALSLITGWLPFSFAEVLICALIIGAVAAAVIITVRICRRRTPPVFLLRAVSFVLLIASCAALFYEGV